MSLGTRLGRRPGQGRANPASRIAGTYRETLEPPRSPGAIDSVGIDLAVRADDCNSFNQGLGDDQPVERVAMVWRKTDQDVRVVDGDRQGRGSEVGQGSVHPGSVRL